ncbi:MAG: tetratricopeptide repeat protein [Pirellulaceae bacterium]|nr:tetratricopeptide repeat protein [Pirellulaceae bacterium]
MSRSTPRNIDSASSQPQFWLLGGGLVSALVAWLFTGREGEGSPRFPFVWFDVALVALWAALPAGWLIGGWLRARTGRLPAALLAALLLAGILVTTLNPPWIPAALRELPFLPVGAPRGGLALIAAMAIGLLPGGLSSSCSGWSAPRWWLPAILIALLVPAAYDHARIRYFETQLAESLAQNNLNRAAVLAADLAMLQPRGEVAGESHAALAARLRERVQALEREIAQPLPSPTTVGMLLARGHQLALLGRVDDAQRVLAPLVALDPPHPAACLHLGAAYELRGDWQAGLDWYERARSALRRLGPLPQSAQPMLLQATKGIAFTQRKLGRLREAEAAYLQALDLAPTAEMHFLLAQFYDDSQQTALAHQHAETAARLDPRQFGDAAEQLIAKLAEHHFGCWGIFTRQSGGNLGR